MNSTEEEDAMVVHHVNLLKKKKVERVRKMFQSMTNIVGFSWFYVSWMKISSFLTLMKHEQTQLKEECVSSTMTQN